MKPKRKVVVQEEQAVETAAPRPIGKRSMFETICILLICLLGAARVFIFSASFPFFNNVDEQTHLDQVVKYSQGILPQGLDNFNDEAARLSATWGSPEYFLKPEDYQGKPFGQPIWTMSSEMSSLVATQGTGEYLGRPSIESVQPPLYYAVAGIWYDFGKLMHLQGGILLYWIRFLNIILAGILVWIAYLFAVRFFPSSRFMRYGLPFLIAFVPQDIYYGIDNDVLSPILFGIAFYCLMDIYLSSDKGFRYYLLAGLAIAAAMLTKVTNFPILFVLGIVVLLKLRQQAAGREAVVRLKSMGVLVAASFAPIALWAIRNYTVMNSFSAQEQYNMYAGWTSKSFTEMWNHPIFTWQGLSGFWNELFESYWRGEFVWHGVRLSWHSVDLFYSLSSLALLIVGVIMFRRSVKEEGAVVNRMATITVVLGFLMLCAMSMHYDFGQWASPSKAKPFFDGGRLIIGTMIPFFALYLSGLEYVFSKIKLKVILPVMLLLIVGVVTYSEFAMSTGAFASNWNLFHMH
jgi:hypothetical protein